MNRYKKEDFENKREREKEERARIREFDRELFSYTGQIAWFLSGLFSFILLVLVAIPVQELGGDRMLVGMGCIMGAWIAYFVLQPYVNVTDSLTPRQKRSETYRKLKYLPVSRKQYRRVREAYLFRYLWKLALIGGILQCVTAGAFMQSLTVWNVVYALCELLVWPLFVGWLLLFTS